MKIFKCLLVLLFLCSFTSQEEVDDEIKKKFFSKIKASIEKRSSYEYKNDILSPKNINSKSLIIDRVELNNSKIDEILKKYNLESEAMEKIRTAFLESQLNVYENFQFSLNKTNLDKITDKAMFTEYIGCVFRQENMINYIILHLSVNMKIHEQRTKKMECYSNYPFSQISRIHTRRSCDYRCIFKNGKEMCGYLGTVRFVHKRRPLNNNEKLRASNLVHTYFGEMFNLMIEDAQKETIKIEENLVVQSVFTTGHVFKNESYYVQAEITDYGDIEIKEIGSTMYHFIFDKECQKNLTSNSFLDLNKKCKINPLCNERKSEYLIADKNGKSSCIKLEELKNEKKNIKMEIYTEGSMTIKSDEEVLFYAKPNIKGKGPFTVGATKEFELQIIDSQNVVVWKSTPVLIHDIQKKNKIIDKIKKNMKKIAKTK